MPPTTSTPAPSPSFGRLITLDEAAEMLHISKRTVAREIARDRFPKPVRIGAASRVSLADVENYVAKLRGAS